MQRPWVVVRRKYGKIKIKLVSEEYQEEIPYPHLARKSRSRSGSDNSEGSEDDEEEASEGHEDDSDAAGASDDARESGGDDGVVDASERIADTDVQRAMLEGKLTADEVLEYMRVGVVAQDEAHAYIQTMTSNVIPKAALCADGELRTKKKNDRSVASVSSATLSFCQFSIFLGIMKQFYFRSCQNCVLNNV